MKRLSDDAKETVWLSIVAALVMVLVYWRFN